MFFILPLIIFLNFLGRESTIKLINILEKYIQFQFFSCFMMFICLFQVYFVHIIDINLNILAILLIYMKKEIKIIYVICKQMIREK